MGVMVAFPGRACMFWLLGMAFSGGSRFSGIASSDWPPRMYCRTMRENGAIAQFGLDLRLVDQELH